MSGFPETRPSLLLGLHSGDVERRERSRRVIAEVYWTAIYKHLRLRFGMNPHGAEDATQGFFVRLIETDLLASYDPDRGRFRTYLRRCLDHHAVDEHRRATAVRRGAKVLPVDFSEVEAELAATQDPAEEAFDREWVRRVMTVAVERVLAQLEQNGKPVHAELFRRFHLHDDPPSYQSAADALGIKVTDANNWLHVARREFRRVALELLREITASEEEFADEARAVFGIDVAAAAG
jgi:RNA polymerase sigma factor (sigma-70 family)